MSLYQPGIPTGTVDLDQDYINLRNNFGQIDTTYTVDHVPLTDGTAQNGYHKALHIVQQVAPAAVSGVGTLYTTTANDGINNSEELFYRSGTVDLNIQLTRNFVPVNAATGTTFLPGGLILKWGTQGGAGTASVPVTFATAFPNACYNVMVIPIRAATSPGSDFSTVVVTGSVSTTGFTIGNIGAHTMAGWYWMAIGN